jgi:soluble lytic murein transglycosylase
MAFLRLGIVDAARRELRSAATGRSSAVRSEFVRIAAAYDLYPEGVHWAARALEASPGRAPGVEPLRRLVYPAAYAGQVVPEAARYGLDPATVWALMRQESLYDARAVSRAGARGLMQIMPATLARMTAEEEAPSLSADVLFHPAANIAFGTQFLAERLAEFGNCLFPTLASYNAGEGKAREWLERAGGDSEEVYLECIGYAETSDYVRRIVWLRWMYHALYEGEPQRSASRE